MQNHPCPLFSLTTIRTGFCIIKRGKKFNDDLPYMKILRNVQRVLKIFFMPIKFLMHLLSYGNSKNYTDYLYCLKTLYVYNLCLHIGFIYSYEINEHEMKKNLNFRKNEFNEMENIYYNYSTQYDQVAINGQNEIEARLSLENDTTFVHFNYKNITDCDSHANIKNIINFLLNNVENNISILVINYEKIISMTLPIFEFYKYAIYQCEVYQFEKGKGSDALIFTNLNSKTNEELDKIILEINNFEQKSRIIIYHEKCIYNNEKKFENFHRLSTNENCKDTKVYFAFNKKFTSADFYDQLTEYLSNENFNQKNLSFYLCNIIHHERNNHFKKDKSVDLFSNDYRNETVKVEFKSPCIEAKELENFKDSLTRFYKNYHKIEELFYIEENCSTTLLSRNEFMFSKYIKYYKSSNFCTKDSLFLRILYNYVKYSNISDDDKIGMLNMCFTSENILCDRCRKNYIIIRQDELKFLNTVYESCQKLSLAYLIALENLKKNYNPINQTKYSEGSFDAQQYNKEIFPLYGKTKKIAINVKIETAETYRETFQILRNDLEKKLNKYNFMVDTFYYDFDFGKLNPHSTDIQFVPKKTYIDCIFVINKNRRP